MKKIKSLLLGLLIVPSLVIAGCGKDDDTTDDSTTSNPIKESLSWVEDKSDLREVFETASSNYTMTVKDLTFTQNNTQDEDSSKWTYSVSNPTYGSEYVYKIVVEDDAILFDAGDKKDENDKFLSYASELALDGTKLKLYDYKYTSSGWESEEVLDYTGTYAPNKKSELVPSEKEFADREIYFAGAWHFINSVINDNSDKELLDVIASWYDSSSSTFKLPQELYSFTDLKPYAQYTGLNGFTTKVSYSNGTNYIYYQYNESYDEYNALNFNKTMLSDIQFKLNGEVLTSLSYNVYFSESLNYNGNRDNNVARGELVGMHVELSNLGTSEISLANNVNADRSEYTGVEVSDAVLDAATTFYNGKNYTVSYKTEFNNYSSALGEERPEYEHVLKVTPTAVSVYRKYYDTSLSTPQLKEEYWMQVKVDNDTYAHYEYDYTTQTWYKYEYDVAEGETTDEALAAYARFYWNTEENSLGGSLDISAQKVSSDYIRYSDTLKSYVRYSTSTSFNYGENELKFNTPYEAIYNFDANGLNFYSARHYAKYSPYEGDTYKYARGYMEKTIFDIGETVIEVPTDFVA